MSTPRLLESAHAAEQARAATMEVQLNQAEEHLQRVAEFAQNLAGTTAGLPPLPAETTRHLLMAVAAFANQGGKTP